MPIILSNSSLLPFLSPSIKPTDKRSKYGVKIGEMFILNKMNNLSIINNASQDDIARVAYPTHFQGVGNWK